MSSSLRWRLLWLVLLLAAVLGLAIAWSASPLRAWLDVDRIVAGLQQLGQSFGPVAAVAGFALASTLAVPLSFLTLVTLVAFGPWAGVGYTLAGALLGAGASYGLGRLLGREVLQRLGGARVNAVSRRLAERGVLAVIAVRMVPVAPFAIANMVAGATHIRLRDMLLGTALGMAPSTLVMAFFMQQIIAALRQPGPLTIAIVLLTLGLLVLGAWVLRRWLR
ncbi:putative membrane protein YdjX (TVP38/TMEM64 family) [Rhodoferax ferrireducens]|uniref:TVP38/TMEM64 family membrane protein n=1 Tax=Rhodoferax ferrireducens TaxID=192843 RepID=A0ABU2C238_9BURK|nr:VTT domain-containing protein [Rhodoferax ferrireducens]MDR7375393.1 putative membrane protein YdjX (TVP38/TMEM64 family) [Rhodoferax ferrireducens]